MEESKPSRGLSNRIYDELKAGILELRFAPGSFLLERSLAAGAGVSRTPVREALKRLAQEGWIVWQERRRAVVRSLTLEDVKEIFALREMIEPFAISAIFSRNESRLLAGRLSFVMNAMHDAMGDPVAFMKEDMKFHSIIISFLGNTRLEDIWRRIADESTRIAIYALYEKRRAEDILQEHGRLVDALWEKDLQVALGRLRDHHREIRLACEEKFLRDSLHGERKAPFPQQRV